MWFSLKCESLPLGVRPLLRIGSGRRDCLFESKG